jgi:5,10-methylenetetrahydromethanopterin reductase
MALTFGFAHVPSEHYRRHVELVLEAERLGFDYAWIPDQTFHRDPYVILTALALSTERIRLGLGATNPFTRHPAMAGRAIASVAECAPGRVSLGVGAGNVRELLDPLGLEFDSPAARCREMVELVQQELSASANGAGFVGSHYRMDGARLQFTIDRRIPVYLAGRGPRVLEAAGEVADGVLIGGLCSPAGIGYAVDRIRRGAAARGRDVAAIDLVSWVTVHLTDDRARDLQRIRPVVAHIIGGAPRTVLDAVGLPSELVDRLKADYRRGGAAAAAAHVTDEWVDAFTIVGDAGLCIERIQTLEDAGVTQFVCLMPPGGVDDHASLIRRLSETVLPALR